MEKVQRVSQQQGLSVASQQVGEQIQIAVMHENYAILANFLTQLVQMGLSIEKMELSSEAGQVKLTASCTIIGKNKDLLSMVFYLMLCLEYADLKSSRLL